MSARDYYAEARVLANHLRVEGFEAWAKKLDDAIAEGFTATEILMALRWHSQELKKAELPLTVDTLDLLDVLLAGLEEVLA